MTSADILFNLFPSTFPPHRQFLLPTSALFLLDESFSLESHLMGESCDYFLLSFIIARNSVMACIFCIVWCQQSSIWNKQIESSIYLIKQVGKCLKSDDQIRWEHRKSRFEEQGNTEIHFIGTSGRLPTGIKASIFYRIPIFCEPNVLP